MNILLTKCLALTLISMTFINPLAFAETQKTNHFSLNKKLTALETETGGRLGIYAINTANNHHLGYRANEIFPTGCTAKVMGVGAILKQSMNDKTLLSRRVNYSKTDLTNWNPITEKHLTEGMTVAELCAAAMSYSDNAAMNLLVKQLGGLHAINAFARSIDNTSFRQDHGWPEEAMAGGKGDLNDSSTPLAMANSLKELTFGTALANTQRELLISWLKDNTTGDKRIKAGVPKHWVVGDKTGTGSFYGTTNDIGIIWPPKCKPVVVAVYYTNNNKKAVNREDVIASATRMLLNEFAQNDECIRINLSMRIKKDIKDLKNS